MVGILVVGVAFVTFFKGCIEYVDCMFMPSVEVSGLKCGYIYLPNRCRYLSNETKNGYVFSTYPKEKFISDSYCVVGMVVRKHVECKFIQPPTNFLDYFQSLIFGNFFCIGPGFSFFNTQNFNKINV